MNEDMVAPKEVGQSEKERLSKPTEQERSKLIGNLYGQGLGRADPMVGNVEVLCGDVLALTSRVRDILEEDMKGPNPGGFNKIERKLDLFLRMTRQVDRFASIRQQLSRREDQD